MLSNNKKIRNPFFSRTEHICFAVFVFLCVLAVIADGRIQNLLWWSAHNQVQADVLPLRDNLAAQIQHRLTYLDALGTYLELDLKPADIEDRFNAFAAGLAAGEEGIQHFTASPGGIIRYAYPSEGSESLLGVDLTVDQSSDMTADIQRAIQTRRIVLSEPISSTSGNISLLSRLAVFDGTNFWGFVGEVTDLAPLLKEAGLNPTPAQFNVALRDSRGNVFWGDPQIFSKNSVNLPVSFLDDSWEIAAMPVGGWEALYQNETVIVRTMGILLIALLTLLTFLISNRQRQLYGTVLERNVQLRRQSEVRQKTEVRLRESEAITSAVLDSSLQSFVLVDRDQTVLLSNHLARQESLKSLGQEILPGKSMRNFIPPQNWENYFSLFNQALMGEIRQEEQRFLLPEGSGRWFEVSYYPVQFSDHEVIGVCVTTSDTTAHKQAEESLRQSEQRFLEIFQANPAAIGIITREENLIVTMNARMEGLLGYKTDDLVGKSIDTLDLWEDLQDKELLEAQIASQQSVVSVETRWRTQASGIRDVIVSASRIMLSNEECLLIMVMDNTERRRNELEREMLFRQLQTSRERLRELTRRLVTVQEDERRRISRELHDEAGQALTALSISLEMLQSDLPPEQADLSQKIADAVELTHATLDRIRSLAQMLRPPALDALGLVPTLTGQCQGFQRRMRIQVSTYFSDLPTLPETYNITFYRCLQEALTNIARHAHASHVWVELRQDNGEISLCIEDDGQGMYHTGEDNDQMVAYGLGLVGLQERLELLEGRLEVESKKGQGTRLVARLPQPEVPGEMRNL
jgi:PAS domain S-box-containing protein